MHLSAVEKGQVENADTVGRGHGADTDTDADTDADADADTNQNSFFSPLQCRTEAKHSLKLLA